MTDLSGRAPALIAAEVELPPHRSSQDEVVSALSILAGEDFLRFAASSGVEFRNLAMPLSDYPKLTGFTEANATYLQVALQLGEQALLSAFAAANIAPSDADVIFSTTVTGLAVPTLDARLAGRVGLRPDVKRVPLFGLGCVAGAAGVARMNDYLRAYPDHVAVLLAVELCTMTMRRNDHSIANLVSASLFGDGAAAVVAVGANRKSRGPRCWRPAAGSTRTPTM